MEKLQYYRRAKLFIKIGICLTAMMTSCMVVMKLKVLIIIVLLSIQLSYCKKDREPDTAGCFVLTYAMLSPAEQQDTELLTLILLKCMIKQ